jgi:hypothetical protein
MNIRRINVFGKARAAPRALRKTNRGYLFAADHACQRKYP